MIKSGYFFNDVYIYKRDLGKKDNFNICDVFIIYLQLNVFLFVEKC